MTRKAIQIALLALCGTAVPASAWGANVAPSSAAGYLFHKPSLTNNIRGVVMGWPPTYRVIRSEDLDWIREAWNERACIMGGTTNIPSRNLNYCSTNILFNSPAIVHRDDAWFGTFRNDRSTQGSDVGWLDGNATLLEGARQIEPDKVTTNYVTETVYTNAVTNALSTITMPMTNGVLSVYTNEWNSERSVMTTQRVAKRHVWTALDWCQPDGSGPFPGNMDAPPDFGTPVWPALSIISNAYRNLRSTVRLADVEADAMNAGICVTQSRVNEEIFDPVMQSYTTRAYELSAEADLNGYGFASESRPVTVELQIPTRFQSALNQLGGKQRIAVEAVFVRVSFSYLSSAGGYVNTSVMVSLPGGSLDTSGQTACVLVQYDAMSVCSLAASAAGAPGVPSAGVRYRPSNGTSQHWYSSADKFVIIYRITPSVRLPD